MDVFSAVLPIISKIFDRILPDQQAKDKANLELLKVSSDINAALVKSSSEVVVAEAKGESWLQRNWRPMLMLFFAMLIGAYWFGFVPPNLTQETINHLFTLIEIGVGGYVVGRSAEKVMSTWANSKSEVLDQFKKQFKGVTPDSIQRLSDIIDRAGEK